MHIYQITHVVRSFDNRGGGKVGRICDIISDGFLCAVENEKLKNVLSF